MSFRCACSASFSRKYHLERHVEVTHGIKAAKGKAELACPLCDKVYYLKSALEKHRVKMHPEKKNEDTDDTDTRKCSVSQVLPKGYEYEILEFHNLQKGFKCKINFDIDRIEESNMFIEEFKSINSTRYRVVASRSTTDILLEKRFCCHHNSRKNRPSKKNTNCSAELLMVIKKGTLENKLLCNVTIYNEHNHETNIAAAVKFLDPSPEVVEKFEKMFENGLSPSMATFKHEEDLQLQYGGEFYKVLSNRRLCPPQVWAFTHYYKIFRKTYGEAIGEGMLTSLKNAIENLCMETNNPKCGKVIVNENGTFTVCIATPLMKRVSSTPLAGNICFLDSTGGLDRFGCRVFLMSCLSSAGGLPIGIIITTTESEEAITDGLQLFTSLLEDDSFGGRSSQGPQIFMTDCSDAERNSLRKVFPECTFLLCTFHVLQAIWRWLSNGINKIPFETRSSLFTIIKKIMYAKDEGEMHMIMEHEIKSLENYPNFIKYFNTWYERRYDWALCLRQNHLTRGQNTNNISEANIRVLKEKILNRNRAFSPVQLVDFLVKDLPLYYQRKLLKIASGLPLNYLKNKNKFEYNSEEYQPQKLTDSSYIIKNLKNGNEYLVNTDVCYCTCKVGETGNMCKHYDIIKNAFGVSHILDFPVTQSEKEQLHYIATGSKTIDGGWYGSLVNGLSEPSIVERTLKPKTIEVITQETIPPVLSEEGTEAKRVALNVAREIFSNICERIENNPSAYGNAIEALEKQYKKIHTDAGLISALHCFGRFNGFSAKKKNAGSSKIGVQSTAIARRKTACGGRRALQSGRPASWSMTPEHGYSVQKRTPGHLPKKKNRNIAPHSLSYCIENTQNISKP